MGLFIGAMTSHLINACVFVLGPAALLKPQEPPEVRCALGRDKVRELASTQLYLYLKDDP